MDNLSLYEITEGIKQVTDAIYDSVDTETGEINTELAKVLNELKVAKEDKLKGYIVVISRSDNDVDLIDKEIKRLKALKDKHERLTTRLRDIMAQNLEIGKKIDLGTHEIAWRKSSAIEIGNKQEFINEWKDSPYVTTKTTYSVNKTEIKKAIQEGNEVLGATLVERQNFQIK